MLLDGKAVEKRLSISCLCPPFQVEPSLMRSTYIDTVEDLKSSDEEERGRVKRGDGVGERRSSLYFDESDGAFGTWKRVKLEK